MEVSKRQLRLAVQDPGMRQDVFNERPLTTSERRYVRLAAKWALRVGHYDSDSENEELHAENYSGDFWPWGVRRGLHDDDDYDYDYDYDED